MMDINSIIGYLEKNEGLIVPENVQFSSYDVMVATAFTQGWSDVPSLEKLQSTWDIIKVEIENQNLLEQKRQIALMNLENDFNNLVAQGYYSADFNITLALQTDDINKLSALINMLNLANRRGFVVPQVEIADINGTIFDFDTVNAELLLLAYGFYYRTIWGNYGANKQSILNETDVNNLL